MASLQQQLIAAPAERFFYFSFVRVDICYIGFRMPGDTVKIAKLAVGNAYIGRVYISVDLPGNFLVITSAIRHQTKTSNSGKQKAFPNISKPSASPSPRAMLCC